MLKKKIIILILKKKNTFPFFNNFINLNLTIDSHFTIFYQVKIKKQNKLTFKHTIHHDNKKKIC